MCLYICTLRVSALGIPTLANARRTHHENGRDSQCHVAGNLELQ